MPASPDLAAELRALPRLPFGKFGLKCDPRGAQVVMDHKGRRLLGDVRGVWRDDLLGATFLDVRHFNGEPWPINPGALDVRVLQRDYAEVDHD